MRNSPDISTQLEDIKNDLEIVKNRISSLDRIAVLENREIILNDLKGIVGASTVRAAILASTRELIAAQALATKLGLDKGHLSREINKFTGNKGYINTIKKGRNIFYLRDEKIDLLEIDGEEPFKDLYERWCQAHSQ